MTDWVLEWAPLEGDLRGHTDWPSHTITLDSGLLQEERRCVIAHEIEHIRRGPSLDDPVLAAREEHRVETAAASRLIDLPRLIRAVQWSQWPEEMAEDCWVDLPTMHCRLDHLTKGERSAIEAAIDPTI